jgi:dipeptidyl aminopeptidase/acylaminoacyl peptidase
MNRTIVFAISVALAAGQVPSIDQSLSLKSVSAPRISPDGRQVAYVVNETNWEDNAFKTEIMVTDLAGGQTFQLTRTRKSSSAPDWSPDGKWIAFLSDREGGKQQIYLISASGGEATVLTKSDTGVNAFRWAPDSKRIAFTAPDPDPKEQKERKDKYGDFEVVNEDIARVHLWLLDIAKPFPAQRYTEDPKFSVGGFAWSPDGARIAFSAARDPRPASSGTADIFVLNLNERIVDRIVETPGPDSNPVWSPSGEEIAYETANGQEFHYFMNRVIAAIAVDGGQPRVLSAAFDENPGLLAWTKDGIYFSGAQKTAAHLFRLSPAAKTVERVSGPAARAYGGFSFSRDYQQVAFLGDGAGDGPGGYAEVYVSATAKFAPRKVTSMSDQLANYKLATREVISWKSSDGALLEGVLMKPANFETGKRYPLLVVIHGGPTGIDRPTIAADRTYPLEMFAAKGALILRPNYRGSAGYGEKFRSLNVRNLGVGDAWDVLSGVDHLVAQGLVDRDRVGAMGWSQGGYISAFLTACHSDRFRAISVGAGISDWMTYYVNTDIPPFTRQYLKATPWDDLEVYRKTSPITCMETRKPKTPTLIQHGEQDRRVPIPNAYELRQALEDRGVPVRMVVYKGFGHGINKPKQQRHVMEDNLKWFAKWLWGEGS